MEETASSSVPVLNASRRNHARQRFAENPHFAPPQPTGPSLWERQLRSYMHLRFYRTTGFAQNNYNLFLHVRTQKPTRLGLEEATPDRIQTNNMAGGRAYSTPAKAAAKSASGAKARSGFMAAAGNLLSTVAPSRGGKRTLQDDSYDQTVNLEKIKVFPEYPAPG